MSSLERGRRPDIQITYIKKRKPWRRQKYQKRSHPVLRKIMLALIVIELGILTRYYYEPGWIHIGFEKEEVNHKIFIRIYYE